MDLLEENGVIGPQDGSRPREILSTGQEETEARNNDMEFLNQALKQTDSALKTLEGKIQEENSPKKLKQYRDEAEMAKFAKKHYAKEKVKKDSIKEGETLTEEQKPVALETALKEAYGKTVSKKSYDKVLKYFAAEEIRNTYKEELEEAAKTEVIEEVVEEEEPEVVLTNVGVGSIKELILFRQKLDLINKYRKSLLTFDSSTLKTMYIGLTRPAVSVFKYAIDPMFNLDGLYANIPFLIIV